MNKLIFKQKGITLIELLVALVILAFVVGGTYRIFVAQSKAYTVQDQVADIQQNIRSTMEILVRDLRMTGFDPDEMPLISLSSPPLGINFNGDNSLRILYQNGNDIRTVEYWRDGASNLNRLQYTNGVPDPGQADSVLLRNVETLNLTYGVDGTESLEESQDGSIDDVNADNIINDQDFVSGATVTAGNLKAIAVLVTLTARPEALRAEGTNEDIQRMVSPRTLTSTVTFRNRCLIKR